MRQDRKNNLNNLYLTTGRYIDKILDKDYSDYFYDLAAFGIIADVMDVRDFETREIIKRGTKNVHNKLFYEICKM